MMGEPMPMRSKEVEWDMQEWKEERAGCVATRWRSATGNFA
jgi:hypothetical protein